MTSGGNILAFVMWMYVVLRQVDEVLRQVDEVMFQVDEVSLQVVQNPKLLHSNCTSYFFRMRHIANHGEFSSISINFQHSQTCAMRGISRIQVVKMID
jgi:hypothetical protein